PWTTGGGRYGRLRLGDQGAGGPQGFADLGEGSVAIDQRSIEAVHPQMRPALYLRALPLFLSLAKDNVLRALDLLEAAIDQDPHYGVALATAATCRFQIDLNGWTDDLSANHRDAIDLARRAIQSAQDDPVTLARAAVALAYFDEDIGATMRLIDRALALNPSYASGWFSSGMMRNWAGLPDQAIEHLEKSRLLSPRTPAGAYSYQVGLAHFLQGRLDEATQLFN